MTKSSSSDSSKRWLQRQQKDVYVAKAKEYGYRSRSAFKLLEIDTKEKLFGSARVIVDLGSAPGGWSQVASQKACHGSRIVALDILDMAPINKVCFIQADFTSDEAQVKLQESIGSKKVDLVICDLAPNFSGVSTVDVLKSYDLAEYALSFVCANMQPGGSFLVKVFQGAGFSDYWAMLKEKFVKIKVLKPEASRKESREQYLLARGFGNKR